mgnify:CR=1 FL=1
MLGWEAHGLLAENGPRMELGGRREATVDGCGGVLEYTETVVRIRYGRGVVKFSGERSLILSGEIQKIEFLPPP